MLALHQSSVSRSQFDIYSFRAISITSLLSLVFLSISTMCSLSNALPQADLSLHLRNGAHRRPGQSQRIHEDLLLIRQPTSYRDAAKLHHSSWRLPIAPTLDGASKKRALIGSSPPRCINKCGACAPCVTVVIPIHANTISPAQYYPEAWRCSCGGAIFNP